MLATFASPISSAIFVNGRATILRSARVQSSGTAAPLYSTIPPDSIAGRNLRSEGSFSASRTLGDDTSGESISPLPMRTWQLDVPERISGPYEGSHDAW